MIYLDTSVVVPLLVPEAKTADVKAWFASLGSIPVSGDWLLTEFASAVSIKVRRKELSESDAKAIRSEFDLLATAGLRIVPISRSAYRMPQRWRHSMYMDCAQVMPCIWR